MKRLSLIAICALLATLSVSAQKSRLSERRGWDSSLHAPLQGHIKSVDIYNYNVRDSFGEVVKDGVKEVQVFKFNPGIHGDVSRELHYNQSSELLQGIFYEYDPNKNTQTATYYNTAGAIYAKKICTYNADNRLVEEAFYDSNGTLNLKVIIKYNTDGDMTERACYDSNGYINDMGKTLYKYDTNRNLTEEVCYNANGEQKSRIIHTYDANNKLTHSIALNYHPALFVSLNNLPYHTLYTYNERGYLTQIERYSEANRDRIHKTVRSYDQNGNLTEEIKYNNGTLETKTIYEYDNSGNRVKMTRYKSEILLIQELIEYKINYYDPTKYTSIEIEGFVEALKKITNNEKIKTDINFAEFEEDIHIAKVVIEEEDIEDEQPFVRVEQMPSFMGGDLTTFRNWVMQRVRYPQLAQERGITGRVMAQIVIEKDGSLTNIKIIQSPDSSLSNEVIRVLKTSPKWTPGRLKNGPVRVMYTLPVEFRLQE